MRTQENTTSQKPKHPGRDPELMKLRNQNLIKRFFYWYETRQTRYEKVLTILSTQEFYLSENRIEAIISENRAMLDELYSKTAVL